MGHDTIAVAGARVILHRVTVQKPGPVDSTVSTANGAFHFRLAPDSGAIYLVSARWAGIEYFATPLSLQGEVRDTGITVVVADTSTNAPVALAARHLIVSPLTADGTRDVVDLYVLDNPGPLTRVPPDTLRAAWAFQLPHFAINVHGGNSGFALETLQYSGDSITLHAAIPPGQRDVEIDYQIPPNSRRFEIAVSESAPVSNIISEDKTLRVVGAFVRADTVIDQKSFARWQGRMIAGQPIVLEFGASGTPGWIVPVLIGTMALILVGFTARSARR